MYCQDMKIAKKLIQLKKKQVLFLWIRRKLPPSSQNIQLVVENEEIFLKGQKDILEEYYKELVQNVSNVFVQIIRLQTEINIEKIRFQIQDIHECKIIQPKTIKYWTQQIFEKYKLQSIKDIFNQLNSKSPNYLIFYCKIEGKDQIMNKIQQFLSNQLTQNKAIDNFPRKESQEKVFNENVKKKKKYKLKNEQNIYKEFEQGEEDNSNHEQEDIQRARVDKKKILFVQQYNKRIFDLNHFRNWIDKNRNLNQKDFDFKVQNNKIIVKLICSEHLQNKLTSLDSYVKYIKIIKIRKQNQIMIPQIQQKYHNPPQVIIRHIEGFVPENKSQEKITHLIITKNIKRNHLNTEPLNVLMIQGLKTQVEKVYGQLQNLLRRQSKRSNVAYEIFLDLNQLQKYIRDKRVKTIINQEIQIELNQNKDIVNSFEILFTNVDAVIIVRINHDMIQKFQNFKTQIINLTSKKIKTYKLQKNMQKSVDKFKDKYIFFEEESGYTLVERVDNLNSAIVQIIQEAAIHQQSIGEIKIKVAKSRMKGLQEQFNKLKSQRGQKFANTSYVEKGNQDKNSTLILLGPSDEIEQMSKELNSYLQLVNANIVEKSYVIQEEEMALIRQSKGLIRQIAQNFKVSIELKEDIQIGALITIDNKIKIQIIKISNYCLDKIAHGTIFFFRSKDQIEKSKNSFLQPFKLKIKSEKSNNLTHYKDEHNNFNFIYHQNYKPSELVPLSQKYLTDAQYRIGIFMPTKHKKEFIISIINQLTQHLDKNLCLIILQNNKQQNFEKMIGIVQSQKFRKQKRLKWYTEQKGKKMYYSEEGMKKISQGLQSKKKQIYLSNEDLQLKVATHILNLQRLTMIHIKSGSQVPVTISPNKICFKLDGRQYNFPQVQYQRVQNEKKNSSKIKVSIGVYLVNLEEMQQFNLFSFFKRQILSEEEEVEIVEVQSLFKAKVQIDYSVKVNQIILLYESSQNKILPKVWNYIQQFLKSKLIQSTIKINPQKYNNHHKIKQVQNIAIQNNVKIFFNQKKDQIKVRGYLQADISRFQKILSFIQKEIESSKIIYPENWNEKQTKQIELFDVDPASEQFKDTQRSFGISQIVKLQRIQNSIIYKKYYEQKLFLTQINQGTTVKEMMLYHGTKKTIPSLIYEDKEQAFNINYTSQSNLLGQGIYFAEKAMYSHSYSHKTNQIIGGDNRQMFYCLVLVGESEKCPGHRGNIKDTSYKNPLKKLRYQSMTDFLQNSNIFVVYKNRRAYPLYLITY